MKKKKSKIKSMPRFVTACAVTLIVLSVGITSIVMAADLISKSNEKTMEESSSKKEANPLESGVSQKEVVKQEAATPVADPLAETKRRLINGDTEGLKVVFLTFDDGPSGNTNAILDVLKRYDVKATFFTLLDQSEEGVQAVKRIVEEGHTLANHTASHNYSLYDVPSQFFANVEVLDGFQRETILDGKETSKIFRFPGGSTNANAACIQGILERGYNYADWNVSSGDGGSNLSKEEVEQNIIGGCREHSVSVVLCHAELKSGTQEALPTVIETLKAEGYIFLPMEKEYSYPRHATV
ncbi:MAG: polysaccharide deacetylase family protein [Eubacteriaceae bacterium]